MSADRAGCDAGRPTAACGCRSDSSAPRLSSRCDRCGRRARSFGRSPRSAASVRTECRRSRARWRRLAAVSYLAVLPASVFVRIRCRTPSARGRAGATAGAEFVGDFPRPQRSAGEGLLVIDGRCIPATLRGRRGHRVPSGTVRISGALSRLRHLRVSVRKTPSRASVRSRASPATGPLLLLLPAARRRLLRGPGSDLGKGEAEGAGFFGDEAFVVGPHLQAVEARVRGVVPLLEPREQLDQ